MAPSLRRVLPALVISLAVGWAVTGCATEEGGNGAGAAVVGNWDATTFIVAGSDAIAAGMGFIFTFDNTGSYTFSVTNDQLGLCETGPIGTNCSDGGDYTATATAITLDPEDDPTVLNYTVIGSVMTITATIDGEALTASFDRI